MAAAHQPPKLGQTGSPDDAKWEGTVIKAFCRRLRDCGDVKFVRTVGFAKIRKTASEGQNDGLHTADTGRKKMRVNQELHSGNFRVVPWPMPGTWCSGPLGKVRALPRERALATASTVAWMFSLGDQASIRERAAVPILESLWRSAKASVSNWARAATCW